MFITGWNSWNHYGSNINEKLVQQTVDTIVSTDLAAVGYQYGLFIRFCFFTDLVIFFIYSQFGWWLARITKCSRCYSS